MGLLLDHPGLFSATPSARSDARPNRPWEFATFLPQRIQRLHPAAQSEERRNRRVSSAAIHERSPSFRGQLNNAPDLLGRQQPRRVDREAGTSGVAALNQQSAFNNTQPPTKIRNSNSDC